MISKFKKSISAILVFAMVLAMSLPVSAAETTGNGLTLSTNAVTLSENVTASVVAALPAGMDAGALTYFVADPSVVTVTRTSVMGNQAAFDFTYAGNGMTTVAIFYAGNEAVVGYVSVSASTIIMDIPKHLGTNKKNYCEMINYTFEDYKFPYADFQDYKYTLKFNYKCVGYDDLDFGKWGCFGYFYDATGNVIGKVHLYCSGLAIGRTYRDECNVPYNAVRFSIEGWN